MPAVSGDCDFSFSLSWNVASSEMPSWTALFDSRPCPAPSGFSFSQSASGPQVLSRQDQLRWCCELPRGQGLAGFFSGTSPVLRMLRGPQHVPSESLGCRGMVRVHGASFHGCPGARGCSDLPALQLAGGALGGGGSSRCAKEHGGGLAAPLPTASPFSLASRECGQAL